MFKLKPTIAATLRGGKILFVVNYCGYSYVPLNCT